MGQDFVQYFPRSIYFENVNGEVVSTPVVFFRGSFAAATTDGALISAVAGKRIRLLQAFVESQTAVASGFSFSSKPAGVGTLISCRFNIGSLGSREIRSHESNAGLIETVTGEGLTFNTGAGAVLDIQIVAVIYTP